MGITEALTVLDEAADEDGPEAPDEANGDDAPDKKAQE